VKLHACHNTNGNAAEKDPESSANSAAASVSEEERQHLRRLLKAVFRQQASEERIDEISNLQLFWPTETELVYHTIVQDQHGNGGYSFHDRLESKLKQLARISQHIQVPLDFVVVGGAASRLPLMQKLLKELFGADAVIWEPDRMKSRVAMGLAWAWQTLKNKAGSQPVCSGDYTTSALAIVDSEGQQSLPWLPICYRIHPPGVTLEQRWFKLELQDEPEFDDTKILQTLRRCSSADGLEWELEICRVHEEGHREPLGRFVSVRSISNETLAPPVEAWTTIKARFLDDEEQIELGIWTSDPERQFWSTTLKTAYGQADQ
jgi:hypothetical protein